MQKDRRGYEMQFGVNHLGHFQLTGWLWPALKNAGAARVVALSSVGHRPIGRQLDDPNFKRHPFDTNKAYGQSKTANSLFAVELDRKDRQYGVRAFAVEDSFKSPQQGAATSIWRALSGQLNQMGGVYCESFSEAATGIEWP